MNIKISNTSYIAGENIIGHKGVVSSRVVIGNHIISEMIAGFTDVFGGRSGTYEKKLGNLYNMLIDSMKIKARDLLANGIIGLTIDIDEINGKGSQMFMISGIGTAVVLEKKENIIETDISISGDLMKKIEEAKQCNELIQKCLENTSKNDIYYDLNDDLSKILSEAIKKGLDINLSDIYLTMLKARKNLFESEKLTTLINNYAQMFYSNEYIDIFYNTCLNFYLSNDDNVYKVFSNINIQKYISQSLDVNYSIINKYIDLFPIYYRRYLFLPILMKYQSRYDRDSILLMKEIISKLKQEPTEMLPVEKNKRGKEKWVCICGASNKIEKDKCESCKSDIYGINEMQKTKTQKSIVFLQNLINIYEEQQQKNLSFNI